MTEFSGRCILLDIEGTTSSVSFVYDVMFPFVLRELEEYLRGHWGDEGLTKACDLIASDAGHDDLTTWAGEKNAQLLVRDEVLRLMNGDVKATGLKRLQGLIWKDGFESGELRAHLFDDTAGAIRRWREADIDVRIYSSGSVQAQKLFFGHTVEGDLLPLLSGHYDTQIGPKRESESYRKIASEIDLPAEQILFLSDVTAELDAAREAGMRTGLVIRPGNAEDAPNGHATLTSLADVAVEPK